MNKRILYAGLPIAALFCGGANAQSVYTDPDILELTPSQQTTVYRTIVRETVVPQQQSTFVRESAQRPIMAATEPRTVRRKQTVRRTNSGNLVRTTTTDRFVTRPAPVRERIVTAPAAETRFVTSDPIDLAPAQRTVVYRTLVQQPVQPVVTDRYLTSPVTRPYVTTEPVVTAPGYAPSTTGSGYVVTDAPSGYVPSTEIVIGSRIPASVPLYAMPAETLAVAPTLSGYRYALIGGRVYLVDPSDGIVSAMLYQ